MKRTGIVNQALIFRLPAKAEFGPYGRTTIRSRFEVSRSDELIYPELIYPESISLIVIGSSAKIPVPQLENYSP